MRYPEVREVLSKYDLESEWRIRISCIFLGFSFFLFLFFNIVYNFVLTLFILVYSVFKSFKCISVLLFPIRITAMTVQ